jgi:hypothetical protein
MVMAVVVLSLLHLTNHTATVGLFGLFVKHF